MRILKNFENFSRLDESVGKPDQPVHKVLFSGIVVKALSIVCVGSHSFGIITIHPLFFGIPESMRKILKIFENCSQPVELVGKLD